jgi:D-serine deaminase-like pyridoxal phosphate-dependent protein
LELLVEEIETPALLIDLDILEKNIATMKEKMSGKKSSFRPHVKAHKSPFIAHKQIRSGAIGITCQTIDEAEVMARNGIQDILLTNMVVTTSKIGRILNLLAYSKVAVTVDNEQNVRALASEAAKKGRTLDVVVEINVGQNRMGVPPGKPALDLALEINRHPSLHFKGLMGYEGHLQCSIPNFEERKRKTHEALAPLIETKDLLVNSHIPVEIVTAGGTGTYNITSDIGGVTEIQPGSYVTMDHRYRMIETCGRDFDCSLSLLATVLSRPSGDRAIVDLGWKSVGLEYQILGWQGMPQAKKDLDGITYSPGGDEHGILSLKGRSQDLRIGDKIEFIPAHCDTALNLYGSFYGTRRGEVEVVCPIARR